MLAWLKSQAKKENIQGLLAHKLDRVCRNMRDAVRLQELQDDLGIKPLFVENQFGPGAAGIFSFNIMAAVSQYYSDNLRGEVLKGLLEKCEQGWLPANAPFGYFNDTQDKNEPIKPHPTRGPTVHRIFELYSQGNFTFKSLADRLAEEGHIHFEGAPRFHRTALAFILHNSFYIGRFKYHERWFEGKHQRLVRREVFETCQDLLSGKNRRRREVRLPLAGGLIRCACCGQAITGEHIRRKLREGGVREHVYYRCGNDEPAQDHPKIRWRGSDVEEAIAHQLTLLKLPTLEMAEWLKRAVQAALADQVTVQQNRRATGKKRMSELRNRQDRLLNAYLDGAVDKETFELKNVEIKEEMAEVEGQLLNAMERDVDAPAIVGAVVDFTQSAAEKWRGSNWEVRREMLDIVSLNRELDIASLKLTWACPFDAFAKASELKDSRGDRI